MTRPLAASTSAPVLLLHVRWALTAALTAAALLPGCEDRGQPVIPQPQPPNGTRKLRVVFDDGVPTVVGAGSTRQTIAEPHPSPSSKPEAPFVWDSPAGWRSVQPSSPMRTAQYVVPRVEGDTDDAELAVFHFPPGAPDIAEATVQRWLSSFDGDRDAAARRTTRVPHGFELELVTVSGVYDPARSSHAPMGEITLAPKQDWALSGAIISTSDGPYLFKLLGPKRTVLASDAAFVALLRSFRPESAPSVAPRPSSSR